MVKVRVPSTLESREATSVLSSKPEFAVYGCAFGLAAFDELVGRHSGADVNDLEPCAGEHHALDSDVDDPGALHHAMRSTPGAANRTLALLSKMFNLAEKWGLRPDGVSLGISLGGLSELISIWWSAFCRVLNV